MIFFSFCAKDTSLNHFKIPYIYIYQVEVFDNIQAGRWDIFIKLKWTPPSFLPVYVLTLSG